MQPVKKKRLIVFDEFADAVAQSQSGNDLRRYEMVVTGYYKNGNNDNVDNVKNSLFCKLQFNRDLLTRTKKTNHESTKIRRHETYNIFSCFL